MKLHAAHALIRAALSKVMSLLMQQHNFHNFILAICFLALKTFIHLCVSVTQPNIMKHMELIFGKYVYILIVSWFHGQVSSSL